MHLILGAVVAAIAINLVSVLPSTAAPISATALDEVRRATSIVQQAGCQRVCAARGALGLRCVLWKRVCSPPPPRGLKVIPN